MRGKPRTLLHVVLFWLLYSYVYPYLKPYLQLPSPAAFQFLDQLTGFPTLASRIASFLYALLLYVFFTIVLERDTWAKAFPLKGALKGLLKGASFALLIAAIMLLLLRLTGQLAFQGLGADGGHLMLLLLAWFIAQAFNAVKEEFVFRGYLLRRLAEKFNKHASLAIVSLAFGLGHFDQYNLPGVVFATVMGISFGYLYLHYRNIWVPIGMHGLWDILSHTLLSGKFLLYQPDHWPHWLGAQENDAYPIILVAVHILFIAGFFARNRLWRL